MGYGICRVQKVKAAAVGSMQYHNDRLPGEHSNPNIVSEWAQELARKMGKPLFDPNSVDYMMQEMREATRVAKALDRDRPHVPQQRGHGAR